ncbi:DUF1631 domain-containing protein [Ramlibacter sp. XY19]|uniref:DUF1631 family protein n=1 Tax=Ramlibacter paludis TaxID=2908000 RepID=UPI0023D9FB69|nr:DUF1631 family protein [Ramlibacter paludis]MCG2594150.1 DUF1631 domain-containing protein [Ramlibacter paludis]
MSGTQPQYQALYRACIKEAAAKGATLMQATLRRALAELPAQAEAISDVVERNLLLDALAVAREQQQALAEAYPQALLAEFAQAIAGDRATPLSFDSLPLLVDEQLQENVHVMRAGEALAQSVQAQLAPFETLLAAARLAPAGGVQRHPLRPEIYVRALHRLARQSPVSAIVRRRWLRYLPLAMAPELAQGYEQLAATLAAQGVVAAPPAPPGPPAPGEDRETQITIRELQKLLAGDAAPMPAIEAGEPPPPDFSQTVPAALTALQDMRKVDQLLLQLRQRQAAMPDSAAGSRADFRAAVHREARTPAQALGLEVVRLMVENLADDPRLLPPVQEAVRDLEPALLRLALADPRFFSDREHPARQLLEEATQRSLAWSDTRAPGFREFLEGLLQAVEVLLETRAAGAEPFEVALEALHEAWDDAQPRARRGGREKAVRALVRAEQRNLLADRIARQLRQRPDALDVPPEALAFLAGPWAQVMAQARLRDDTGADDPGGWSSVVQGVLWSVQPALCGRAGAQPGQLAGRIEAGLASIDHPAGETARWQALLRKLRVQAQFKAAGAEPHASEPAPLPPGVDTWLAPLEMHDSGFVPELRTPSGWDRPEPETLPPVELRPGTWVDVLGEGWERWQLTWASPHGLLFLFAQGNGASRSMTRRRLQEMLAEGSLRLVATQAVVDGALDAVVRAAWKNSL